jgi:hypothetical protein
MTEGGGRTAEEEKEGVSVRSSRILRAGFDSSTSLWITRRKTRCAWAKEVGAEPHPPEDVRYGRRSSERPSRSFAALRMTEGDEGGGEGASVRSSRIFRAGSSVCSGRRKEIRVARRLTSHPFPLKEGGQSRRGSARGPREKKKEHRFAEIL